MNETENTKKIKQEHICGEPSPEGFCHSTVHIWIRNLKGEYLLLRRSANKPIWECVVGTVPKEESSINGALRNVKEEVGLELETDTGKLIFSKIHNQPFYNRMDVWLFLYDGKLPLETTTTKIAAWKWMSASEIKKRYKEKNLVQTLDYFFCAMEAEEPDYSHIIGKTVKGTIDRPLGTSHPQYPELIYPINYGHLDDVFANDREEQDIYLFGTDQALTNFEGKVIAVWRRFNDVEDKWIVSLNGENISQEKILRDISFQEQFFYGKLYQ